MTRPPPRGKAARRFYALLALARKAPTMAQRFALFKQAEALRKGPIGALPSARSSGGGVKPVAQQTRRRARHQGAEKRPKSEG